MAAVDPWAPVSIDGQPVAAQTPDNPYLPMFEDLERSNAAAQQKGVPEAQVVSPAGAIGRYQVMPSTARLYGLDPSKLSDPDYNKMAANVIANDLQRKYGNDPERMAIDYNGGQRRVDQWVKANRNDAVLPAETQDYLRRARAWQKQAGGKDPWAPVAIDGKPVGAAAAGDPWGAPVLIDGKPVTKAAPPAPESSWADILKPDFSSAWARLKRGGINAARYLYNQDPTAPTVFGLPLPGAKGQLESNPELAKAVEKQREPFNIWAAKTTSDLDADIKANAPHLEPGSAKNYTYQALTGVTEMIPVLAVGAVTKNPFAAAAVMGEQAGGEAYAGALANGRSQGQAQMDASFSALVNGGMGALPLGVLMKPGGAFLAKTLKSAGAFGMQSVATEAIQLGYDKGLVTPDMTWSEAWPKLVDAGIVGTLTGAFVGAGHAGVEHAVARMRATKAAPGPRVEPTAASTGVPPDEPPPPPGSPGMATADLLSKVGLTPPGRTAPPGEPPGPSGPSGPLPVNVSGPAVTQDVRLEIERLGREGTEAAAAAHAGPTESQIAAAGPQRGTGPIPPEALMGGVRPLDQLTPKQRAAYVPGSESVVTPEDLAIAHGGIERRIVAPDTAFTASGRPVPVSYAVVEASSLTPSQTVNGGPNPRYPQELQPRDRTRLTSLAQIASIAGNLNPRLLDKSADAGGGAPIISSAGIVESGNGRTLAIQQAYQQGLASAEHYRDYLAAQGYPVEGMKHPVLVRVREGKMTPEERQSFVREANQSGQLRYSATEQAMTDAGQLPEHAMDLYRGGEVTAASNREFVKAFLTSSVPASEHGQMIGPNGELSQDAIRRINAAMFAKAYGDPDLVTAVAENSDTNIKAIGGALTDAAPEWARMRAKAADGRIPAELDQTNKLLEAVRLVAQARQDGRNVAEYVNQKDIFTGEAVDPEVESWLRVMFRPEEKATKEFSRPVGRDRLADAIKWVAQESQKVQGGPNLLGMEPTSSAEILEAARRRQYGDQPQQQVGFASPPPADYGGGAGEGRGERNGPGFEAPAGAGGRPAAQGGDQGTLAPGEVTQGPFGPEPKDFPFERFVARPGADRDLTRELEDYISRSGFGPGMRDPVALAPSLASYVAQRGRLTGFEQFAAFDPVSGKGHASTTNQEKTVGLSDAMTITLNNPNSRTISFHNHPTGHAPSGSDLATLAFPGHAVMNVATQSGLWYGATLRARTVDGTPPLFHRGGPAIEKAYQAAMAAIRKVMDPHVVLEPPYATIGGPEDEANIAFFHAINEAMHRAGVIHYETSHEVRSPEARRILEEGITHAAARIARIIDADGYFVRQPHADRRAGSVQFEEGLPRLLGAARGEPAPSADQSGAGNRVGLPGGNQEAGRERQTYRKPEQLQLLNPRERYRVSDERVHELIRNHWQALSDVTAIGLKHGINVDEGGFNSKRWGEVAREHWGELQPETQKTLMSVAAAPTKNGPVLRLGDDVGANLRLSHTALLNVLEERRGGRGYFAEDLPAFPQNPQTGQPITTEPLAGQLKIIEQLGKDRDVQGLKDAIGYHTDPNVPAHMRGEQSTIAEQYARDVLKAIEQPQYATEPGATDAKGNPLPQMIIPGAEGSAAQLAKAREASGKGLKTTKAKQKEAGGLFAPGEGTDQLSLFSTPKVKHPVGFEEDRGPYAPEDRPMARVRDLMSKLDENAKILIAPMTAGKQTQIAAAKDWANLNRYAMDAARQRDQALVKNFTPDQRKRMWVAADQESVNRQRHKLGLPVAGEGLESLTPEERAAVTAEQADMQQAWDAARKAGMVKGDALPSYMPRLLVAISETGSRPLGQDKGVGRSIPGMGHNLRTQSGNLLRRKYLTTPETEAAASAKTGEKAEVVKDIRVAPLVASRVRRAVAGHVLIQQIKDYGAKIGRDLVWEGGDVPPERKTFTMQNPSFFKWQPKMVENKETGKFEPAINQNGDTVFEKIPIHVDAEWEGPLRAILSEDEGAIYRGFMQMKAKAMNTTMFSPFVQLHLLTELGRALPVAPLKIISTKLLFEGNAAKHDPETRYEAIMHGMVPISHQGAWQDISGMAEPDSVKPGRSWTAKVAGLIPGAFDKAAGTNSKEAVYRAVDKVGDFLHNTLLWDRVADLQFGIYTTMRDSLLEKGYSRQTAQYVAAHWANRYAGTLSQESMSHLARKVANVALFSRTYTLGNMGVAKDMITGLPRDVSAQIERDGKPGELAKVKSYARRKAIGAVTFDVALMYAMMDIAAAGFAVLAGATTDAIWQGYAKRMHDLGEKARTNPLAVMNPLTDIDALSITAGNEIDENTGSPLKRILIGYEKDGTAIYARNPVGKFAEEYTNWLQAPVPTARSKLNPLIIRPTLDVLTNSTGLGDQKVWLGTDPGWVKAAKIAQHYMEAPLPMDTLRAAYDEATGQHSFTSTAKLIGRAAGVTFRKGYPGGPEVGAIAQALKARREAINDAIPSIMQQLRAGDIAGARERMRELKVGKREQMRYIRAARRPKGTITPTMRREFKRYATPEQKARLQDIEEAQP